MASALISCQGLTKAHSLRPLFKNLTFGINDGERVGLIGPNGSGKSTLMQILAGQEKPDAGTVSPRKGLQMVYVPQTESFPEGATIEDVLKRAQAAQTTDEAEKAVNRDIVVAQMEFADREQAVETLSGGWKKRLALARAVLQEPELLLLDEPTNHLDLDGVLWLENYLQSVPFAWMVVSHDRYFLENTARRIIELNPAYEGGYLSSDGTYSDFVENREGYLARQAQQQVALASVVRREVAWLRRGAQARSTKAKGRIEAAGNLIADLQELKTRNNLADRDVAGLDFSASGRQTKEMVVLKNVAKSFGDKHLLRDVSVMVSPKRRLGLVGPNGSGKTTLLRLITGDLTADSGTVKRADNLNVIWFEQSRTSLDRTLTLKDALSPNSDTVRYRGGEMHVSGWAQRFLFRKDQLEQSVGAMSGGEQARVLIARLMLQPADLLILDEPTNDLDIPTLDVLEESLTSFPGAVVLVTHDRFMLDSVATEVVGLMGDGTLRHFADYEQYETARREMEAAQAAQQAKAMAKTAPPPPVPRVALTTSERRELTTIEDKIEKAELVVGEWEQAMNDPAVNSDAAKLQEAWGALQTARDAVAALYVRWEELEAKKGGE